MLWHIVYDIETLIQNPNQSSMDTGTGSTNYTIVPSSRVHRDSPTKGPLSDSPIQLKISWYTPFDIAHTI